MSTGRPKALYSRLHDFNHTHTSAKGRALRYHTVLYEWRIYNIYDVYVASFTPEVVQPFTG